MMRRACLLLCVALLLAGCASAPAGGPQKIGTLTVEFHPDPDPPHAGLDTNFIVPLKDASGPVSGATVHVQLYFKGLNQTGPSGDAAEKSPGRYETGPLVTGMGGKWEAEVTVQ